MTRLSAEELRITPAELDALIWVRDALDPTISDHTLPNWMRFDMDSWDGVDAGDRVSTKCQTGCCIGGSMELHMAGLTRHRKAFTPSVEEAQLALEALPHRSGSPSLYALFFGYEGVPNKRTDAVAAIDRFLAGNTQDPWARQS